MSKPDPAIPQSLISHVVQAYGLGVVTDVWPAVHGIENRNFFIVTRLPETNGAEQALVITVQNQSSFAGDAYVDVLLKADAAGLPVPRPLPTIDGATAIEYEGRPVRVSRRLAGQHVFNPDGDQLAALGRTVARLHLGLSSLEDRVEVYPRDERWLERQCDQCRGKIDFSFQSLIDASLNEVTRMLARTDVKQLPTGIIHGDLFRDNVLFNEHGLSGVLDFHHAAKGYWLFDLAVIANDWCTDSAGRLDVAKVDRLLQSYAQIRPLQRKELWYFPLFCSYAALVFLLSRLVVNLQAPDEGERRKDPAVFRRILEHHRRHFLYLDERLFNPKTPS